MLTFSYLAVVFRHNCYPIYSLSLNAHAAGHVFVDRALEHCIVLYCIVWYWLLSSEDTARRGARARSRNEPVCGSGRGDSCWQRRRRRRSLDWSDETRQRLQPRRLEPLPQTLAARSVYSTIQQLVGGVAQ